MAVNSQADIGSSAITRRAPKTGRLEQALQLLGKTTNSNFSVLVVITSSW